MRVLASAILGAVSILALTASTASAEIVCNRVGECWHVRDHGWIRSEHGLIVHPDNWRWADHERERYRWREHEGRGYWREGHWVEVR
ncbi:MAG: hypothetical protein WAN43_07965 [Rhodomicrobium sp.]